jgi:hypothetical protein
MRRSEVTSATGRRAELAAIGLLLPILLTAQNYVFGPNVRVNDDPPGASFHSTYSPGQHLISCRGDTVYLVWRDDRLGEAHVYFARSNDAGQTFLPNVRVDRSPSAGNPSIAVDDSGVIHVSFASVNSGNCVFAYYAKSADGGRSFLPPVRACDSLHMTQPGLPSIAVSKSGRNVFVARSESRNDSYPASTYQIKLSRSTDGGQSFLRPDTRVCPDTWMNHYDPTVAVFNDSIVLVAWVRDEDSVNGENTYFARSTDFGATFEPPILLSDSTRPNYYIDPSIGVDSMGRVFVCFGGLSGVMVSSDTGRTFEVRPGEAYGEALWVLEGGQLYIARTIGSSDHYVEFCYSPDAGETFMPPVEPRDTNYYYVWESYPTVCANREGKVFVAWSDNRNNPQSVNDDIYCATGSMAGIEEAGRLPGTRLECSVQPSPARGPIRIDYQLTSAGRTRIDVLDQSGRSVALLFDHVQQAGRFNLVWNGLDVRGNRADCGVYFIRLAAPAGCLTRKVVRIG